MDVEYNDLTGSKVGKNYSVKGQLFGNQNEGYERWICVGNDGKKHDYLMVSGVDSSAQHFALFPNRFPPDANPLQTDKFFVLSCHWNRKGESGCGSDRSFLYINGKKIVTFTANALVGLNYFILGRIIEADYIHDKPYATWLNGEIGRFLVCGSRAHPMNEEAIENTHKYLMEEWGINQTPKINRQLLSQSTNFYAQNAIATN